MDSSSYSILSTSSGGRGLDDLPTLGVLEGSGPKSSSKVEGNWNEGSSSSSVSTVAFGLVVALTGALVLGLEGTDFGLADGLASGTLLLLLPEL